MSDAIGVVLVVVRIWHTTVQIGEGSEQEKINGCTS